MRKIEKPNLDPRDVYLACVRGVRNEQLRARLQAIANDIEIAADDYDTKAECGNFYLIRQHNNVGGSVTGQEMEKVYTLRMAQKRRAGRKFYDELKASVDICPLCGQRVVSQLDHYLPKTNYPSLVVVPFNLVPSCSDCNKAKLADNPTSSESQTLHPYYDDVTNEQWLFAEVIEESPPAAKFFVNAPADWGNVTKDRIQYHFEKLELDDLYRSQAGVELSNIRELLINLFDKGGKTLVSDFLNDSASSRLENHVNSWQTALYRALAENDWFCSGGFRDV